MNKVFDMTDALFSLMGNEGWSTAGNIAIFSATESINPTQEELDTEILRLQSEYDDQEYSRLRKAAYDELNQDELRFDDLMNNTTTWQDAILAIKALYLK